MNAVKTTFENQTLSWTLSDEEVTLPKPLVKAVQYHFIAFSQLFCFSKHVTEILNEIINKNPTCGLAYNSVTPDEAYI